MSTWPILAVHRRRRTDSRISNSELKRQHMCASRERVPRRLRVVLLAPPFSRRRRTNVLLQYNFGLRHAHRSESATSATKFILIDKNCQNGSLLVCMSRTVSTGLWHDDDVVPVSTPMSTCSSLGHNWSVTPTTANSTSLTNRFKVRSRRADCTVVVYLSRALLMHGHDRSNGTLLLLRFKDQSDT